MLYDRVFALSLGLSALIHLSMVTVFSIVIVFPIEHVDYYDFEIVQDAPAPRSILAVRGIPTLTAPPADDPLALDTLQTQLPEIQLPTLEFAEFQRLRLRQEGLTLRARFTDSFDLPPQDTWARFGQEIGNLGAALSRLTLGEPGQEPESRPRPVGHPALGFETYIEWMSEPKDRQLIFAPPIEALWGLDPAQLQQPIVFVFKVNPIGKVIEVLNPIEDKAGITTSAARALAKYRFEPLDPALAEAPQDQQGTLIITRAREGP